MLFFVVFWNICDYCDEVWANLLDEEIYGLVIFIIIGDN